MMLPSVARMLILLIAVLPGVARAADRPPTAGEVQLFESKIRPILVGTCIKCHGEKKQRGGLRLDSRAALLAGGDRGPAVRPGHPEDSLLVKAIGHADELKMPPDRRLPAAQIADLTRWVQMGAPWPEVESPTTTIRRGEFKITDRDRAHWAFQPVRRPPLPTVKDGSWASNPVDAFVLARLEARGLRPNPPAPRRELARRLYYDLTGLPPTPQEVEAFVHDPSPGAYEALVERLLSSPHYGEKWGRHWLDLVRFAETNSYERDNPKPHAWRYRDYVLRSFNQDQPYDRFVREQLAGDELPDGGTDGLIATGYYRLGIWDDEPSDAEQARFDGLDDIVATTGQVFLGLTFDCARCHDHKLDPIPQKDYYRLLAFFHNINHYRNGGPTDEATLIPPPADTDPEPPVKAEPRPKVQKVRTPACLCVSEAGPRAPETFVMLRGNPHVRGDKVAPAFPEILGAAAVVVPSPPPGAHSTGRRRVLADWIAAPDNPLTARVMANRVWQYHFGRGLVRSPNNFGLQGDRPTHPELLDWLAAELVSKGWRLKPLHRLILTSRAYRMSSRAQPEALAADPANDLFWRFDMRRLTAEEVRDSILAISGTLNPKMYGPGIYPELPDEVLAGQSMRGYGWGKSPPQEQARRSVYIHVKRSLLTPILESFDMAETDRSTAVRFATTQPGQALGLLNSDFLNRQAAALAVRVRREAGGDPARQVRLTLALATARPATEEEVARGLRFLREVQTEDGASAEAALRCFCLMVLNLNEFVYLD
jgi:cytochrome c553